jgi:hypothetical protein
MNAANLQLEGLLLALCALLDGLKQKGLLTAQETKRRFPLRKPIRSPIRSGFPSSVLPVLTG